VSRGILAYSCVWDGVVDGDVGLACDCDAMSKKLEEDKVAPDKIRLDSIPLMAISQ